MRSRWTAPAALLLAAGAALFPAPAHALRVVTWNLFQYPDYSLAGRQPYFRTVMRNIDADVLIVQELLSQAGRDSFLLNVLNVAEPGEWTGTDFWNLQASPSPEGGAIFWKPSRVNVSFVSTFPTSGPRDVLFGRVTPVGYTALSATFRVYSVHLKAGGPATSDSTTSSGSTTSSQVCVTSVRVATVSRSASNSWRTARATCSRDSGRASPAASSFALAHAATMPPTPRL